MARNTPKKLPRRGSSRRGQQNTSTRDIMLSHRNADDGPSVIHENGESEDALPESMATNPNLPRVKKRYMFTFAMVVFFGQIQCELLQGFEDMQFKAKIFGWQQQQTSEKCWIFKCYVLLCSGCESKYE